MNINDYILDPELVPFCYKNGKLYCENVEVETIFTDTEKQCSYSASGYHETITFEEPLTPVYVYSLGGVYRNVKNYVEAMELSNLKGKIGYAVKANPNIHLVQRMKQFGVEILIAVSGYEVLTGIKAGFAPENIILNGNGKQRWEMKLAIEHGVMMNVDSLFDAHRIVEVLEEIKSDNEVNVFLRIRPNNPNDQLTVHEYVNTAERSKFGFSFSELDEVLDTLSSKENIKIIGIHCHFGSGISNPTVYEWLGSTISEIRDELTTKGVSIKAINVGGGIGIDYNENPLGFNQCIKDLTTEVHSSFEECKKNVREVHKVPPISSFLSALSSTIPKNVDVIMEPGRSLGKQLFGMCAQNMQL